jgi:hypothetical protein
MQPAQEHPADTAAQAEYADEALDQPDNGGQEAGPSGAEPEPTWLTAFTFPTQFTPVYRAQHEYASKPAPAGGALPA